MDINIFHKLSKMMDAYDAVKVSKKARNYFVSGANHAGEIRGLVATGWNVGVAAPEVGQAAEAELKSLAGSDTKVFVDSGAFGEITFERGYPEVKKPITDAMWMVIFGLYLRLARVLGAQLYVVAPDKVAFQADTLARLREYAHVVKALRALGANIIVPVQKGKLSMAEFAVQAMAILGVGVGDVIWGIPSKKDATSVEDLMGFAKWLNSVAAGCETKIHLLGLGIMAKDRYDGRVHAIRAASPRTVVFSDSVRITAMVGRCRRPDGTERPRKLTAALDAAKATGKYKNATEWKAAAMSVVFAAEMAAVIAAEALAA